MNSRRHSITKSSENIVVTKTSYQMLEVVFFLLRSGEGLPSFVIKIVRAFHKLLEIFQKVFPVISILKKLLQKQSKVAFCNENCSKVARIKQNLFWSDAKICKLHNNSKISRH